MLAILPTVLLLGLTLVYLEPTSYTSPLSRFHRTKDANAAISEGGEDNRVSNEPTVALVAATTRAVDTSWIPEYFPEWQHHIYSVDESTATLSTRNRGREGSAYLSYILDNYADDDHNTLADYVIFSHDARYEWHNDDPMYDAVPLLRRLNLTRVDEEGYINLRCTWKPGCDGDVKIEPTTKWTKTPEAKKQNSSNIHFMTLFGRAMAELFPHTPEPDVVRNQCCAQFAVSKKRILELPRERYEQFLDFLWDWHFRKYVPEIESDTIGIYNMSDPDIENVISGNLMENMWHMLFGKRPDNCMAAGECYCKNFGLCKLDCPTAGKCKGRYWPAPLDHKMPAGWPEEGQGEHGWPIERWWELDL